MEKKGTVEGMKGQASKRMIKDEDFEICKDLLKKHGWNFSVTDAQAKALEAGKVPTKLKCTLADASQVFTTSTHCVAQELKVIVVCKLVTHGILFRIKFYTYLGNLFSGAELIVDVLRDSVVCLLLGQVTWLHIRKMFGAQTEPDHA